MKSSNNKDCSKIDCRSCATCPNYDRIDLLKEEIKEAILNNGYYNVFIGGINRGRELLMLRLAIADNLLVETVLVVYDMNTTMVKAYISHAEDRQEFKNFYKKLSKDVRKRLKDEIKNVYTNCDHNMVLYTCYEMDFRRTKKKRI